MSKQTVSTANGMALLVLTALLILIGGLIWELMQSTQSARAMVQRTHEITEAIQDLRFAIHDAETGQRGFLLTNQELYLVPYEAGGAHVALARDQLQRLEADNLAQQARLRALAPLLQQKLDELALTVQLRRTSGFEAAVTIVRADGGLGLMDRIQNILDAMMLEEQDRLHQRLELVTRRDAWVRVVAMGATALAILALLGAMVLLNNSWVRSYRSEREQRSLVQQLRATLDSLAQGVGVFSPDHTLLNWNEAFRSMLGVPKAMVRTGTPYAAFAEHTLVEGSPLLESDEVVRDVSAPAKGGIMHERARPGGKILEVRRTATPNGGFVLTIADLTRRAQSDAVLRDAQKMKAVGQLTGNIAHDFNNLLTVMLGNLEILGTKLDKASPLHVSVKRAAAAAQLGAGLTAQLLTFASREPLAPVATDLAVIVPQLISMLRRTLGAQIEITCVTSPDLWPAMADTAQLENALLNLALNAQDAMPDGGRLTIEVANCTADQTVHAQDPAVGTVEYVMLSVADTGYGMPQDVLDHVFEPFFTTKFGGYGLGLASVLSFAKQSGGHVTLSSQQGKGTVACLYLPRAMSLPVLVPLPVVSVTPERGTATVLLVEDDLAVREVASTMLSDLGYQVREASDGEVALRMFGTHAAEIDVLLIDVVLSGKVRGRDVAERITAMRPDIRVLFVSGYAEHTVMDRGWLDRGAKLVQKPFTRDQLARGMVEALAGTPGGIGQPEQKNELEPSLEA